MHQHTNENDQSTAESHRRKGTAWQRDFLEMKDKSEYHMSYVVRQSAKRLSCDSFNDRAYA